MRASKTFTYDIPGEWAQLPNGDTHGNPMAHIVVEFPAFSDDMPTFRASIKEIFEEILEACK